ncbi:MAG: hypothetical protein P8048_06230 [Calditrichia bacterium]
MLNGTSGLVKLILSVLFFPMFFQTAFIDFAWGNFDPTWMMLSKRLFLLLPVLAIILGCWVTMACLLTVLIRQKRQEFVIALFITWWDLGKSIVSFWGGIFKFLFEFLASLLGLLKILAMGLWSLIQEVLFLPFRLIRGISRNVVSSPVPWIAVFLTIFWCLVEAVIFTYVTTPLVVDTFSNITGEQLTVAFVRIPLFIFLLFIVLGSYAVLSTMVDAVKTKNISAILGIGVIEIVTLFVEVVFLYREFVDSLVPWFAQYSENFQLGIFWTLALSIFVWFGIRSLSWFLFASHGTPTMMSIIQGKGVQIISSGDNARNKVLVSTSEFMNKIKQDSAWFQRKGDELLTAIMLPPLQVVAAAINFCTLLITSKHLFELPYKNMDEIKKSTVLIESIAPKAKKARSV